MSIEGPISVQIIEGQEDQLKINEKKLKKAMENLFEGDQIELEFKLASTVSIINRAMDKLLDIKIIDRGAINAQDGIKEGQIVKLIADKLNSSIKTFLSNENNIFDSLILSLDEIGKQIELSKEEKGYYDEFITILDENKEKSFLRNVVAGMFPKLDNYGKGV